MGAGHLKQVRRALTGARAPKSEALATKPEPLSVSLTPKHLKAAIAFRDRAAVTVISDKKTDEGALVTIKEGKALKRQIEADWDLVKRPLRELGEKIRDLERAELEAVDAGLKPITDRHVAWKEADDARIAREAQAERDRKEREEKAKREAELQRQEDAAAELEAASDDLSARELWFTTKVVERNIDTGRGMQRDVAAMVLICKEAGYKDPAKAVDRLLALPKIVKAIAGSVAAKAIREQAEALRDQPLAVTTTKVVSNVAKVGGTRNTTSYACAGIDNIEKFVAAYKNGELDDAAMKPDHVFLNSEAVRLKDKFELAYPGARLKTTKGVAG